MVESFFFGEYIDQLWHSKFEMADLTDSFFLAKQEGSTISFPVLFSFEYPLDFALPATNQIKWAEAFIFRIVP